MSDSIGILRLGEYIDGNLVEARDAIGLWSKARFFRRPANVLSDVVNNVFAVKFDR